MTVYHQIQKAIDFAERHLDMKENADIRAAAEACMSLRNFHRLFSAITGMSWKQYVRRRVLSASLNMLKNAGKTILEIALDCGYETPESYSRAFKKEFNILPSEYQKNPGEKEVLSKFNLLEESYMELVVKQLADMRVAYHRVISESPEHDCWKIFSMWAEEQGLFKKPYRIFGYDNPIPNPKEDYEYNDPELGKHLVTQKYYGYEYFMPVEDHIEGNGIVKIKTVPGGRFVVYGVIKSGDGEAWIRNGWKEMSRLLNKTHYKKKICYSLPFYGHMPRWYEEHLDFYPESGKMRLDLYLEIE